MAQTTVYDMEKQTFEPTPIMRERFHETLAEYLETIAQMWRDAGEEADSDKGVAALEAVRYTMTVPEREQWMHPLDAVGTLTATDEPTDSLAAHLENRDAMRTMWGLSTKESTQLVADIMDLTPQTVRAFYSVKSVERQKAWRDVGRAKTALYRHYDGNGVLLYVGITCDFTNRNSVHNVMSPWWKYVTDTQVEWYPNRRAAMDAETCSIRNEEPLFNAVHSRVPDSERKQADYLRAHLLTLERHSM